VVKSRRISQSGDIALLEETRNTSKLLSENMNERHHTKDLALDGRALLKMDQKEIRYEFMDTYLDQDRVQWWGSYEHGNEPSGSKNGGESLHQLSEC
jgi:hypothetical protein